MEGSSVTLVQAHIAAGGKAVVLTSDRLASRRMGKSMPAYEFEGQVPKITVRPQVALGFAGSGIDANKILKNLTEEFASFGEVKDEVANSIGEERHQRIENMIKRYTGVDAKDFFENPQLPIPSRIRKLIYGKISQTGEATTPLVKCRSIIAGFDENEKARVGVIDHHGDFIDKTYSGRVSIGSGAPFSTIYFDQYKYEKDIELAEALLFSYEAKKWAEAPTGVGKKTDMVLFKKTKENDHTEVKKKAIYEGDPLLEKMEQYYQKKRETARRERKKVKEKLTKALP